MNGRVNFIYKQKGLSLLEVLVSLLVIGLGLTMSIALMVMSNRFADSAENRNIAMQEISSMIDQIRANPLGIDVYVGGKVSNASCTQSDVGKKLLCKATNLAESRAAKELEEWQLRLPTVLPLAKGSVVTVEKKEKIYMVQLSWQIGDMRAADGNGQTVETFGIAFSL